MECECAVACASMLLQVVAWSSLACFKFTHCRRQAQIGEYAFVGCLTGLGFVILIAALQQTSCALSAGMTSTLLAVALIAPPFSHGSADTYSLLYPPEST